MAKEGPRRGGVRRREVGTGSSGQDFGVSLEVEVGQNGYTTESLVTSFRPRFRFLSTTEGGGLLRSEEGMTSVPLSRGSRSQRRSPQ